MNPSDLRLLSVSSPLIVLLSILGCGQDEPAGDLSSQDRPRPIGEQPGEGEEFGEQRRAWIERMHRTAPDVDWRQVNRQNALLEMQRRNRLVRGRGPGQEANTPRWNEVGSSNQAGRMHCAVFGPDGQTLYSGSDRGGLWRQSPGADWEPLSDNLYGGVNELAVLPGNTPSDPDVLVAATNGGSIHVSTDDGLTWTASGGIAAVSAIRGFQVMQDASQTVVFFGQTGNSCAVYASTDKGASFAPRWSSLTGGATGFLFAPRSGAAAASTIYLTHKGRLLRSNDAGFNFSLLDTVDSGASSAYLTGSEAGSPTLYLALRISGTWKLYRSTNGGNSFSFRSNLSDFWGPLCASIQSPDTLVFGGVEAHRSTNGGTSFSKINSWGSYYGNPAARLHADMMGIYCVEDPTDPAEEIWFICTDGGTYWSLDQTATVSNLSLSGLGVSQYYTTHTSRNDPDLILAGSQDQGYQRGSFQAPLPAGPSTPFTQMISGDYGHMTSSDGSHGLVYSTYPGFILVQEGESSPNLLSPFVDFPPGSQHDWLPMVVADPLDPEHFFFCGDRLSRYERSSGPYWNRFQHSSQDFTVGGGAYLTALAFAPSNPQRAYAVNNAALLFYSTDHGVNWTNPTGGAPWQHYFYGNAIAVHPSDEMECVIGGSGYSSDGVIRTTNGGLSWSALNSGLPATHVYDLCYAEDGSGDLYAATDAGAFCFDRAAGNWVNIMEVNTPLTTYWCVEAVPSRGLIRFGTYGRGIWDYALDPCEGLATSYGSGCPGTGGITPTLSLDGCPGPGESILIRVQDAVPGTIAILMVGFQQANLPLNDGCTLLVSSLVTPFPVMVIGGLPGAGNGQGTLPGSIAPGTPPTQVFMQAWVKDAAGSKGYVASNALDVMIQ